MLQVHLKAITGKVVGFKITASNIIKNNSISGQVIDMMMWMLIRKEHTEQLVS